MKLRKMQSFKTLLGFFMLVIITQISGHRSSNIDNNLFNLNLFNEVLDSELCERQLSYLSANDTILAFEFLESGLRVPRGLLSGNTADFGNYFQCLGIKEEVSDMIIEGKFCMIRISLEEIANSTLSRGSKFNIASKLRDENFLNRLKQYQNLQSELRAIQGLRNTVRTSYDKRNAADESLPEWFGPFEIQLAMCIPKPCTTQEAFDFSPFAIQEFTEYEDMFCRLPNDKQYVTGDYFAWSIFSFILLLTLLSTTYDIHHTVIQGNDPKKANILLRSFSVYTNAQRLCTFNDTPDALECVDGIRTLALLWVVVGHTFVVAISALPVANAIYLMEWLQSVKAIWVTTGPITVDTFFTLSGLLVVYTTTGKFSNMKFLKNVHYFYLNRILRILPLVATAVLMEVSFIGHITDGPYFETIAQRVANCRNYWWTTLLFVQNYANNDEMCLGHLWYLDVDMQIYILSPLILFWVYKGKRSAWIALVTGLLVVLVGSSIFNFLNSFPGGPIVPSRFGEITAYADKYYFNTLTRGSPFFVGMICGYVLHLLRAKPLRIHKIQAVLLWLCALSIITAILYYHYHLMQCDWDNIFVDNFMNSYMRMGWALAISWITIACAKGYGGPVNWFLSHKIWKLPARLSFSMYILHYSFIYLVNSTQLQPNYYSAGKYMYLFVSDITLAFIFGFIITLLIDAPCSILIKLALGGGGKRQNSIDEKSVDERTNEKNANCVLTEEITANKMN